MLYTYESELQKDLANIDFNFYDSYKIAFQKREVNVGGCIPDLVSIYINQTPIISKWPKYWTYRHSYIFWLIKNYEALSVNEITNLCFEEPKKVLPIINDLSNCRFISGNNSGRYSVNNIFKQTRTGVVAIEAKLSDWKKALCQAIKYKRFANISFVAMDAEKLSDLSIDYQTFIDNEIGLCSVYQKSITWYVHPSIRNTGLNHENEYLIMSAIFPKTQIKWSRR